MLTHRHQGKAATGLCTFVLVYCVQKSRCRISECHGSGRKQITAQSRSTPPGRSAPISKIQYCESVGSIRILSPDTTGTATRGRAASNLGSVDILAEDLDIDVSTSTIISFSLRSTKMFLLFSPVASRCPIRCILKLTTTSPWRGRQGCLLCSERG